MSAAILRDLPPVGRAQPRIWIASELMYPELTSTGFYVAAIAERLASTARVVVLCAQPTYGARGTRAAAIEEWRGVTIRRGWGTTFNKNSVPGRLANLLTFSLSTLATLVRRLRPEDVVLVVTNPPTLPLAAAAACWWRRSRLVVIVHDLYPDTLVAAAGVAERATVVRAWRWMNARLFARAEHIIVVGRDMKVRLERHHGGVAEKVRVVANWGEVESVRPADRASNALLTEHGLTDRFVVLYAGNLGRPNDLATIVGAARRLGDDPRFHFVFVGDGVKGPWLRDAVHGGGLTNVLLLGQRSRSAQQDFLNACDVAVAPFVRGMWGVAVPSRLYNFLAAGKPILAIAEPDSEIDLVIRETGTGWVTPPHDVERFVAALRDAASDPARLTRMGALARHAAEEHYSGRTALDRYASIVGGMVAEDQGT